MSLRQSFWEFRVSDRPWLRWMPEWERTPGDTLTLRESLALALANTPRLQSFGWEVRAREAQALQAVHSVFEESAAD